MFAAGGVVLINIAGGQKPVIYYNWEYNDMEQQYSISDRELLAIIIFYGILSIYYLVILFKYLWTIRH